MKPTLFHQKQNLTNYFIGFIFLILSFSTVIGQTYCTPTYPNGGGSWNISNVKIISKSFNHSPSSSVHDYTSQSFSAFPGDIIAMEVTTTGWTGVGVAVDWSKDGDFADADEILYTSGNPGAATKTFSFPITIPSGVPANSYRLRVWNRCGNSAGDQLKGDPCDNYSDASFVVSGKNNGYGSWVDYTVNILPPCSGTPDPGTVSSPIILCSSSSGFVLQTSQPLSPSVTGQWQESSDNITWTDITGATTNPYTVGTITPTMYYRLKVTCTTSGSSAYSGVIEVKATGTDQPSSYYPFGANEWKVYGFNSVYTHDKYKNPTQVFTDYKGYYTQKLDVASDYGVNTTYSWSSWVSPAYAVAFNNATGQGSKWYGCSDALGEADWNGSNWSDGRSKYTYISKRKGFPAGNYNIKFTNWDDDTYIFVNGTRLTYAKEYDGDGTPSAWGNNTMIRNCVYLDENSTVEIRSHGGGSPNSIIIEIKKVNITMDVTSGTNQNVCHGIQVTLGGSDNSVNAGTVAYQWTGNNIVSGASTLSPTVAPTETTTYQLKGTYEMCADSSTVTITLPYKTDIIAGNNESATCQVSGNNPIHFYNTGTGHYIGSINPMNRTGKITITSFISTFGSTAGVDDGTMYSCNSFGNESFRTAYMERGFVVKEDVALSAGSNVKVYFPFTKTEFDNLSSNSINKTPGNGFDNISISGIGNLVATKFDASAGNLSYENASPTDNCGKGTSVVVGQSASGNLAGSTPFTLPQVIPATNNYRYAMFEVQDFSEFHFHGPNNNSPLPIELTSFSGNCKNGVTTLTWTTATETDVNHFEIMQSTDGIEWKQVGETEAVGNSSHSNTYTMTARQLEEIAYYRLISEDNDGTREAFNPISVQCKGQNSSWFVYPIPVANKANVSIVSNEKKTVRVTLVDINGRILETKNWLILVGTNQFEWNVQSLASGVYFIQMEDEQFQPLKFMKE